MTTNNVKELLSTTPENLAERQYLALLSETKATLSRLISHVEKGEFDEAREMLAASPSGDGYGLDNRCVCFSHVVLCRNNDGWERFDRWFLLPSIDASPPPSVSQASVGNAIDRDELIAMLTDLATVNIQKDAAERQARRMADALIEKLRMAATPVGNEEIVYLRDLDGTGPMHPCSNGDRGAVAYVPLEFSPAAAPVENEADPFGYVLPKSGVDNGYYFFTPKEFEHVEERFRYLYTPLYKQSSPPENNRYQHKKRGTVYRLIGEAQIQTETPLTDYELVVVYQCEADGELWARRKSEFYDGRFALVSREERQEVRAVPRVLSL